MPGALLCLLLVLAAQQRAMETDECDPSVIFYRRLKPDTCTVATIHGKHASIRLKKYISKLGGRHAGELLEDPWLARRRAIFYVCRRAGGGAAEGDEAVCLQLGRAQSRQIDHSERQQRQDSDSRRLLPHPASQGRRAVRLRR